MEEIHKTKQYAYSANSNLVLTRGTAKYRDAGPSSEVKSLRALDLEQLKSEMGSRVTREKPSELVKRLGKTHTKEQQAEDAHRIAQHRKQQDVFEAAISSGVYQPTTRESRAAYDVMLSFIQQHIGDKPRDVLMDAAHEVLAILKEQEVKLKDKKQEVESLLSGGRTMSEDAFSTLWNIVEKINDFRDDLVDEEAADPDAQREEGMDEEEGVPVVFDEDDEDDGDADAGITMELGDEEDEDAEDMDVDMKTGIQDGDRGRAGNGAMVDDEEEKQNELDAKSIDAYWLQRQLSKFYSDAHESQRIADQVFQHMDDISGTKDHACENKLVLLLGYDRFEFIKLLMRNRRKIVWCIRRARAKEGRDRVAVEAEMLEDPELRPVLEQLHRSTADRDIEKRMLKEARGLQQTKDIIDGSGADSSSIIISGSKSSAVSTEGDDFYWNKRPKTKLDLENLSFDGAHFMSNKGVKVPKGTEFLKHKGYQEVIIRPKSDVGSALDDSDPKNRRIPIKELPQWARPGFRGLESLNRVQSQVHRCALLSKENMLLCAPTSAGKTNVALLTMLREIGDHLRPATPDDPDDVGVWISEKDDSQMPLPEEELKRVGQRMVVDKSSFKIVYVAPMKSLVQEMCMSFSKRLAPYGVTVKELSGDVQLSRQQIHDTQVIVTTPEKWDIITRKTGDRNVFAQLVRLMIVDEIHLLHDSRGPVLESIIARTIRQTETSQQLTRLVGLSATLPNYEDVALFLRVDIEKPDSGLFFFDSQFRPCPLFQTYVGLSVKSAFKRMQMMNEITYEKAIEQVKKGHQVLVFVHSRKETGNTARTIRDMSQEKDEDQHLCSEGARQMLLAEEAETISDRHLKDLLPHGLGIHHAGMNREDRTRVEELFDDGHIRVLVSTATLAWGVNLPAHAVIIKGTEVYSSEKGTWTELSPLDVMQMMGRAGRPQHDTFGEGIIITSFKHLNFYLSLLNEQLPVESQFVKKLPDNLNAEIVLGSVTNLREAVSWLRYTYLYVRMLRNPGLYGISFEEIEADPTLEQRCVDLIHSAALFLDRSRLVKYDRKSGNFQVTELGRVASHYYITHQSVAAFNEYLKPNLSDIELLRIFSLSTEFQNMSVRQEEKMELVKLLDTTPIPIKEAVTEPSAKCNVLLQAYISNLSLDGFALRSDLVYITQSAGRVLRALFEILLRRGWAQPARRALELCKMVDRRMWAAQSPLRQFRGSIPGEVIRRLEGKDFGWDRLWDLEPHALGELVRLPKFGRRLHKSIHQLPRLELQAHVQPITRSLLRCELLLTPDFEWSAKVHGHAEAFWIMVEDVDGETLLHYEYFLLKAKLSRTEHTVTFTVPIQDPMPPQYFIRVVSDRWLGSETVLPVSFRHLILPQPFPAPTELLDLQPLSSSEIANADWIDFFADRFENFNPIQTQTFGAIFQRPQASAFVAAPPGSGKTVLAELAIIRMLMSDPDARCVYIAPLKALVDQTFEAWSSSFGNRGIPITRLSGESGPDLRMVAEGQIILSTPEHWDVISRRWKTRKAVQNVSLLLVDELHLLGGESGPVLEVVVSRMRYMAGQLQRQLRIVGLAASVANGRDIGEWLGAPSSSIFCFHPNRRPIPMEIRIQGYEQSHFETRIHAMVKPAYRQITQLAQEKSTLIFVPSRRHAEHIVFDLAALRASDPSGEAWLKADEEVLKQHLAHVSSRRLQQALLLGAGFFHAGLTPTERGVVRHLFTHGIIKVLVVDQAECWSLNVRAGLVQVLGAQFWEGREFRYVDLSMASLLQIMGMASPDPKQHGGRHGAALLGQFSLFCHLSRKEFYKKFLNEPFPVESHLDHALADHMNAEIVHRRIEALQDSVDYLTWSFYYRRLAQNPNYYGMAGISHRHLSDHLSELVENTLDELVRAGCISRDAGEDEQDREREVRRVERQARLDDPKTTDEERRILEAEQEEDEPEEGSLLTPLNLGMIAAYYNLSCQTVDLFAQSLASGSGIKQLLEILSNATEFDSTSIRYREDNQLRVLSRRLPLVIPKAEEEAYSSPPIKVHALLQAHFSRFPLIPQARADQSEIIGKCSPLLQAMVDVLASSGWLKPALATMELSQMLSQGLWNHESPLLQLPHVGSDFAEKAQKLFNISTVPELLELEDEERSQLLKGLTVSQVNDVALMCNNFPDLDCAWQLVSDEDSDDSDSEEKKPTDSVSFPSGSQVLLQVRITRDPDDDDDEDSDEEDNSGKNLGVPVASTPRFPRQKLEGWWLLLGRPERNELLGIKRLSLRQQKHTDVQLAFTAPAEGSHDLTLYLMSDSYLGVDQEYPVPLKVSESIDDRMSDDE